jgi:uncharacterized membrane protein required for colicin V production
MTPYDAAMIGVVVAGMVWGAWRGITWQVASIASLVLGYLFAHPLSAQLAPHLPGDPVVARALAMLVVYAAVSGGVFFVAWLVRATLRRLRFEAFDRHLGMVLGGLEGALLGMVATLFVVSLAPQTRGPIFQSPSGRVVALVMDTVGPVLPGELRGAIEPFWAHLQPAAANPEDLPAKAAEAKAETDRAPAPTPADAGGEATSLRGLYERGRARVGRAAADAVAREIEQLGNRDGGDAPRR